MVSSHQVPFCDHVQWESPPNTVRRVLSAKGSDSSFAEAHKVVLSEPTHIEGEDEDMGETVKSAEWRVEENQDAQPHETWMTLCALHLEPVSRATPS